jgi:hypothetical protein
LALGFGLLSTAGAFGQDEGDRQLVGVERVPEVREAPNQAFDFLHQVADVDLGSPLGEVKHLPGVSGHRPEKITACREIVTTGNGGESWCIDAFRGGSRLRDQPTGCPVVLAVLSVLSFLLHPL